MKLICLEKLFLNNPYIKEFRADIEGIGEKNGRILVVLDRTAFYPEGEGQLYDTGIIDGCSVSCIYEENNCVYHIESALDSAEIILKNKYINLGRICYGI